MKLTASSFLLKKNPNYTPDENISTNLSVHVQKTLTKILFQVVFHEIKKKHSSTSIFHK